MRNVFPAVRLPQPQCEEWEWQLQAACHAMPASMFFPTTETGRSARARRECEAKRVCAACPVIERCRRHALETFEPHGIWGGLTARERLRVLRG
ncbi:WhiB family transcriptional regulator [Rhodococcus fascians]|nr:WhiB family transcriptional regulator [Rhodococcus fascians]MBY4237857.1 WhiB family transcriptional regulator [Rhodococcus fascians]MBY4253392.1 WhiB family transcriptional regulator [Rhodococcus fascians]MBY4269029.1 WhiB family transcriptional regulator [Rhodococcus fascians]MBY4275082.1 WhiB family transcriptional regulator [Rhodococcus fascians]